MLGLALHELATNAAKYGALASHKGQVRVSWQVRTQAEPPDVVLEWKESSGAIDPEAPRRRGFGADLLERALTYELEADVRIAYEPDGVRCTVAAPLARLQEMGE